MAKTLTNEGATQYDHSLNHEVEFFSKAGSLFSTKTKKDFYGNSTTALELFKTMWIAGNKELSMKLLFWLRDCRGGAGNRSGFRDCMRWLAETEPAWLNANTSLIPEHGRWDDLRYLFGTDVEEEAVKVWVDAIKKGHGLASKWADRTDKPILRSLRKSGTVRDIGEFRRLLSKNRDNIVERKMCQNEWDAIKYPHVPSVAMSRLNKAFGRHDPEGFAKFKEKVEKGEEKINASVLFPHDCTRAVYNGDKQIADAQFTALPNFMEGTKRRIMPIVDTSGSMGCNVGGSIRAIDVSTSLGLYCSDRIEGPFHRKFIQFCDEGKFTDWTGKKFSECYAGGGYYSRGIFNGAIGSTRIDKALDLILSMATTWQATDEQIPNTLLIISDMQFTGGCSTDNMTVVEHCIKKWEDAGYSRPDILYWNTNGYAGAPTTINHPNVGLVSGFTPSVLKAVLTGEDFTPRGIMLRAVEKYNVKSPS